MGLKETRMGLKVDLKCHKCYKKVKKILCKFPQIREQKYDEKRDMVTITVVCCNPEKLRDKICCKGGGIIKSIEILEPPKPVQNPPPSSSPVSVTPETVPVTPAPVEVSIGVCVHGYGGLPPCYCCCYGRPYACHCWNEYLLCEENTSGCSVM